MAVGVDDVEQSHDICVVEFSQDRNLTYGGAGDTLVFSLETDLFEGDDAAVVAEITGFVDNSIGTWTR